NRFSHLFSSFSHVELLVLEVPPHSPSLLEDIVETMGNFQVKNLELRGYFRISDRIRTLILDMIRQHGVRHVSISKSPQDLNRQIQFVKDVLHLGATIDIFENGHPTGPEFFGQTRDFWSKKANELSMEGISMVVSRKGDAAFSSVITYRSCTAHVSFMTTEQRKMGIN
ncbi:hypothetical protein PENTCL1PPCAC_4953, partial [Pristionchus entomophagus]